MSGTRLVPESPAWRLSGNLPQGTVADLQTVSRNLVGCLSGPSPAARTTAEKVGHDGDSSQSLYDAAQPTVKLRIFPMRTHWMSVYLAALREQDPAKIPDLCDEARRVINNRALELGKQGAEAPERKELEEALRQLVVHELKKPRRRSQVTHLCGFDPAAKIASGRISHHKPPLGAPLT